jgi:hypothetical protein
MTHSVFLKLHIKQSSHSIHGKAWANRLYSGLLRDRNLKSHISLLSERDAGVSFGADEAISNPAYDGGNDLGVRLICKKLNLRLPTKPYIFAAGSMFAYSASYGKLLRSHASELLSLAWEKERGQLDGTVAHALERLWLHLAWDNNLTVSSVKFGIEIPVDEELWTQNFVPTVEL